MTGNGVRTAQILVVCPDDEVSELFNYSFRVKG